MAYSGDDIYCDEILSGRIEVQRVLETERVVAFHHTNPFWATHLVVIPKEHVTSLIGEDVPDDLLAETLHVVREVARRVVEESGESGVMTYAGHFQHSKHLHWHVVAGDQLRLMPPRADR